MIKNAHDLVTEAKALIEEVAIKDADQAIQDADVLIDVREADEYAAGYISGAIHASRGMLEFKLTNDSALNSRELKIVLYCKTSGRAALAAASMKNMGYLHVKSITGGFDAWMSADKPIVIPHMPNLD
ncbi:rhodanese-related sulfurtransferase [Pseudomonas sp. JAI120]|nr:rhodanese-related sulfurtransferase [Pseudomonas sp. SJZ073]MBB6311863.1 rhodanese-related sulfurtransferase [Pseudomonas sp. JAI120]